MPIVVDEVIISIEVSNAASGGASPGAGSSAASAGGGADDKQALISECVERVLEILERREER